MLGIKPKLTASKSRLPLHPHTLTFSLTYLQLYYPTFSSLNMPAIPCFRPKHVLLHFPGELLPGFPAPHCSGLPHRSPSEDLCRPSSLMLFHCYSLAQHSDSFTELISVKHTLFANMFIFSLPHLSVNSIMPGPYSGLVIIDRQ